MQRNATRIRFKALCFPVEGNYCPPPLRAPRGVSALSRKPFAVRLHLLHAQIAVNAPRIRSRAFQVVHMARGAEMDSRGHSVRLWRAQQLRTRFASVARLCQSPRRHNIAGTARLVQ